MEKGLKRNRCLFPANFYFHEKSSLKNYCDMSLIKFAEECLQNTSVKKINKIINKYL